MIFVDNIKKSYFLEGREQPIEALRGISFEIKAGEFVALVGPSGSGKSTLLACLAGLDQPSSGTVTIDKVDINQLSEGELTEFRGRRLGFIFQSYHLIPSLTALENVALPLELRRDRSARERAAEVIAQVGLTGRQSHLPRQLSGGEQQRVAIARALVVEPKVIFADEPTGNLDSVNGNRILELLGSLKHRTTIVMVSHDRELAARADRQLYLRDGLLTAPAQL